MPAGYTGATNATRLLYFLCLSDAQITDKESPAQAIEESYKGGVGSMPSCYSPTMLYTTQVLDAAIRTANALHSEMPFDFAISLGDDANGPQYNELQWFIDVMDGKYITPSSGTNAGSETIDYQKPFQAAGLDPSIPWYAVMGNHDHLFMGGLPLQPFVPYFTNEYILALEGDFMGTIDGSTPDGNVIDVGPVTNFIVGGVTNTPTVAADANRYGLTSSNWMSEFFNTTSQPVGHGFSLDNVTNDFACYTFEPKTNVPIEVIVLDDTVNVVNGEGSLDAAHFNWLTNELQLGQSQNQLMIVAAHIPIELIGDSSAISSSTVIRLKHVEDQLVMRIGCFILRCGFRNQFSQRHLLKHVHAQNL